MKDFLESIQIRFSQPFILSFLIGWIVWNWEIVVGLLWYDSQSIILYGYCSFGTLIEDHIDFKNNWLYPILTATLYPVVKLAFGVLYTGVRTLNEKADRWVSKPGYITASEYLEMLDKHDRNIASLSEIINSKSDTQRKYEELVVESANQKLAHVNLENENAALNLKLTANQISHFNGIWNVRIEKDFIYYAGQMHFKDGAGETIDKTNEALGALNFRNLKITKYLCNIDSKETAIHFSAGAEKTGGGHLVQFESAKWNSDFTALEDSKGSLFMQMVARDN